MQTALWCGEGCCDTERTRDFVSSLLQRYCKVIMWGCYVFSRVYWFSKDHMCLFHEISLLVILHFISLIIVVLQAHLPNLHAPQMPIGVPGTVTTIMFLASCKISCIGCYWSTKIGVWQGNTCWAFYDMFHVKSECYSVDFHLNLAISHLDGASAWKI